MTSNAHSGLSIALRIEVRDADPEVLGFAKFQVNVQ